MVPFFSSQRLLINCKWSNGGCEFFIPSSLLLSLLKEIMDMNSLIEYESLITTF